MTDNYKIRRGALKTLQTVEDLQKHQAWRKIYEQHDCTEKTKEKISQHKKKTKKKKTLMPPEE